MVTITKEFLTELGWKVDETKEIGSDFQEIAQLLGCKLALYSELSKNGDSYTTHCSIFNPEIGTVFCGSIEDEDFLEMITCSEVYGERLSKIFIKKLGWEFRYPGLAVLKDFAMFIYYLDDNRFIHEASYKIESSKDELVFKGKLENTTDLLTIMRTLGIEGREIRWSKD